MTCGHLAALAAGCETAFAIDASRVTFGTLCLRETGERARALGIRRAAVFTDPRLRALPWFDEVTSSLHAAAIDTVVFDEVSIEPTDASSEAAARFAAEARADGYISLGGGSVIDTAKAANLYATHPAPLRTYVNAPAGDARAIPGPLAPHIACPTTSGTGSEVTGIAIFDWLSLHAKTGIASPRLRPTEALVDPRVTQTLPSTVVAASGMDVLSHALESFTAKGYFTRLLGPPRPMSQGRNPWSDIGCREALRILGTHLIPAVAGIPQSREQVMWAATLAGIAFGNSGVHVPHAMAYAVAGRAHAFRAPDYPNKVVPHGMAVAVNLPSTIDTIRHDRYREAAQLLGGKDLRTRVIEIMRRIGIPNGTGEIGYTAADIPGLVASTLPQQRLLANAPVAITEPLLTTLFERSLCYW
jgi:alcohol dehydrogenase class IV